MLGLCVHVLGLSIHVVFFMIHMLGLYVHLFGLGTSESVVVYIIVGALYGIILLLNILSNLSLCPQVLFEIQQCRGLPQCEILRYKIRSYSLLGFDSNPFIRARTSITMSGLATLGLMTAVASSRVVLSLVASRTIVMFTLFHM